jgi:hypothetical protein
MDKNIKRRGWLAEFRDGTVTQEIWVCFQKEDEEVVSEFVAQGLREDFMYGTLCRKLCESRDLGVDHDFLPLAGPWGRKLANELFVESEPYLGIILGGGGARSATPWAFVWLPSFRSNPAILSHSLECVAEGLRTKTTVLTEIAERRLALPKQVLVSTWAQRERKSPPRVATGARFRNTEIRDKGGRPRKWSYEKIRAQAEKLFGRQGWHLGPTEASRRIRKACEREGIPCPNVDTLRAQVRAWRRQVAASKPL